MSRTYEQQYADRLRIAEIDEMFKGSTGWGSWMVEASREREEIVERLRGEGFALAHKYLARTESGGKVS